MLVQAPAGFGKTSLLSQWRREAQAHGKVVAWVSAQPQDDPRRFVQALALAVRSGAGRPTFGHTLLEAEPPGGLEAVTVWLAELAHIALNVVLIVDEAERLPAASRERARLPAAQRAVQPARGGGGACRCQPGHRRPRRLRPMRRRRAGTAALHARRDAGTGARPPRQRSSITTPRRACTSWPRAGRWACSSRSPSSPAAATPTRRSPRRPQLGDSLRGRLMGLLLSNLDPSDLAFLTRVAILDYLHPDLCRALVNADDAAERLVRLARDTPVFVVGEAGDWLRMHTLAHEALRDRFAALPKVEQAALHDRAAGWLAGPRAGRDGGAPCAGGGPARTRLRTRRAQPLRIDDVARPEQRRARMARPPARRRARPPTAADARGGLVAGAVANGTTRPAAWSRGSSPASATTTRCAANAR